MCFLGFKTKWFFEVVLRILFWLFPAYVGTHSNCFRMLFAESPKLVSLKTVGDLVLDFCTDHALVGGREGSGWQGMCPLCICKLAHSFKIAGILAFKLVLGFELLAIIFLLHIRIKFYCGC